MNRLTRIVAALIATGLVAVASGRATFAAFSVTTQNPNDSYAAGNVSIADNDAASAEVVASSARRVTVGYTSLVDWPMLTWSFGWTRV